MRLYLIQKTVDNFRIFSAWDQRTHFPSLQTSIRSFRPRFNWVKSCSAEFTKTMGSQRGLRTFKWKSHLISRFKLSTRQTSGKSFGDVVFFFFKGVWMASRGTLECGDEWYRIWINYGYQNSISRENSRAASISITLSKQFNAPPWWHRMSPAT